MTKTIGDYLYTANARFKSVTTWEIIGITEKQYHCKKVGSEEFRYFSKNDIVTFDTKEEAEQAIANFKKKENLKFLIHILPLVIFAAMFAILTHII